MKYYLTFISAFLLFITQTFAQAPCTSSTPPASECANTCIYCDLDGATGTNNGAPSGGNTVCGAIAVHNPQWWGFQAGSTSMTINVATSNCQNGDGLQVAIFEDCSGVDAVACNPGTPGGGSLQLVVNYQAFIPGKNYFLMIDGWTGDVCDYEILVMEGNTFPCADILTACDTNCINLCDSVFCGEGYHTATCHDSTQYSFFLHIAHPQAEISGTPSLTCAAPYTYLEATASGGNLKWLDASGQSLGGSNSLLVENAGWYTLQVTNGACVAEDKLLVKDLSQVPNISASGCTLDPVTGKCTLKGNSISSPVTYAWHGPFGFYSTKKNPVVSVAGTYTLYVNNPNTGCFNTLSVEVTH